MLKPLALLLCGTAIAQQGGPSIEDMLADDSNSIHRTVGGSAPDDSSVYGNYAKYANTASGDGDGDGNGFGDGDGDGSGFGAGAGSTNPLQDSNFGNSPPNPGNPKGSIGSIMGGLAGAMAGGASKEDQKPDMFGRKPQTNPFGGLFGGGKPKSAPGAGAPRQKPNPLMDTLLNSIESRMPVNQKMAEKSGAVQPISQESKQIVSGLIEQFMHKVTLEPGEKACLDRNLATLTADVVGTAQDLVNGVKAIINGKKPGGGVQLKGKAQGTLVSAGLDGAMKLTSLVTMSTGLLKNCVKGDALDLLKKTGRHCINMQWLGHRLLVSGVDIAHHLSAAITSYEAKNWKGFGEHIGIAMRKVLLSKSETGSRLPEGVPEEAIIQEATQGLMAGFFVRGAGVEITDSAAPDVDIQLDLHRCIAGNHEFFKEAWLAMWNLIAQISVNGAKHDINNIQDFGNMFQMQRRDGSQPKWMGEMMIAMMQVPMALNRCNIGADTQQMFMEAIKSMKFVKVHFLFPKHKITADEAAKRMAKAVESWTNWNFKDFGKQIGKLLREFVLLMYPVGNTQYPQMYSVDANGRLRRQLNENYRPSVAKSLLSKVGGRSLTNSSVAFAISGLALTMLVALVAVRGLRAMNRESHRDPDGEGSDGDIGSHFLEVE